MSIIVNFATIMDIFIITLITTQKISINSNGINEID